MDLSIVVPCYNEEGSLPLLFSAVDDAFATSGVSYELVLVNDGSSDGTSHLLHELPTPASAERIVVVDFSRNFGKEAAIFAGLAQARGACCVVLDCDLQHPPEKIVDMYRLWQQGYQVVEGVKLSRGKESPLHTLAVRCFSRAMSGSPGLDMSRASDFKLLDRKAVESVLAMPERSMFFRAASSWIGFKSISVPFEVQEREAGESKWSAGTLISYAFRNIVAFTTLPLQFVTAGAVGCFGCSLLLLVYSLVRYFSGHAVEGYTTLLIVMLFIGSAVMMSLGIIGYYIARIYEEVKRRPRYIVSKIIRGGDTNEKVDP